MLRPRGGEEGGVEGSLEGENTIFGLLEKIIVSAIFFLKQKVVRLFERPGLKISNASCEVKKRS